MEGSWEGISGCVVCIKSVYVLGGCNVVATEHGRYIVCLVCRNCEQCWVCMVCCEF